MYAIRSYYAAGPCALARIHRAMLAATSWTARLKNGLARTRAALGGGLGALFGRAAVDESLYEALEEALLTADCGVEATRTLLAPLEKPLELGRPRPLVLIRITSYNVCYTKLLRMLIMYLLK